MKKILSTFCLFLCFFFSAGEVFAAECTLNTVPSPAVDSFSKNVDTLLEAAKKAAEGTQCTKSEGGSAYLDVAIPAQSVRALLGNLKSVGYDINGLLSDIRYYFDSSDVMLLPNISQHQNSILGIQQKIHEAAIFIGSRCAQGVVTFKEDIKLDNNTIYKTKGRTLQDVLNDLNRQTKEVLTFYRNLVTNVADREYLDESNFNIAPAGFAQKMREFYSSTNIQQCHEQEPKNQKIKETLKQAFTTGWKYPQAIQIWKDAFALLLYRGGQLAGSGTKDDSKESQINSLVQAQKGGVGNSRFLLNGQFFKEFGKKGNNQTIMETVKETAKRIAHETFGSIYSRQTVADLGKAKKGGTVTISDFPKSDIDGRNLAAIDKGLYSDYATRKVLVGQSKEQDPKTVVGLIQSLEQLEIARPIVEENAKLACDIYGKQATNVPRPTCQELFNI